MLKNKEHNILHQLSEISDSLWRIEKHYMEESKNCETCLDLWRALHADYTRHVELLTEELKKHLKDSGNRE